MFRKIKHDRMYENIVNQVIEALMRGDLKPGEKLPSENELTEIFNVSRVTVREAIRSLEQIGLVEVKQGSQGGAYLKDVDIDALVSQIGQVFRLAKVTFPELVTTMACLEREVVSEILPSKINEEGLQELTRNIEKAEACFKNKRMAEGVRVNFNFHIILNEISENSIMILMMKLIEDLTISFFLQLDRSPAFFNKIIEDHKSLAELLKQGEFKKAGDYCFRYIKENGEYVMENSKMAKKAERKSLFNQFREGQT
mgnify:CR=1 FL=1